MHSPLDPGAPARTPIVHVRCDPDERLSDRLVEVVSAVVGVSPLEMTPPLGTIVDLEALDLFVERPTGEAIRVAASFTYGDVEIVVAGDRSIRVYDAPGARTNDAP
jgi:hypothetical protein